MIHCGLKFNSCRFSQPIKHFSDGVWRSLQLCLTHPPLPVIPHTHHRADWFIAATISVAIPYSCCYRGVFLLTSVTLLFLSCSCRSFSRLNHVLKQLIQQKNRTVPVLFSELKRRAAELYVRCHISTPKCNKCIGVYFFPPFLFLCIHFIRFWYCSFTRQLNTNVAIIAATVSV